MSYTTDFWLRCDKCGDLSDFADGTLEKVREMGESHGWTSRPVGGGKPWNSKDFCPRCSQERKKDGTP